MSDQQTASQPARRSGRAEQLLEENRSRLESLADQLLLHETLDEPNAYAPAGIERVPQS
jgi:cell division protease FtsH